MCFSFGVCLVFIITVFVMICISVYEIANNARIHKDNIQFLKELIFGVCSSSLVVWGCVCFEILPPILQKEKLNDLNYIEGMSYGVPTNGGFILSLESTDNKITNGPVLDFCLVTSNNPDFLDEKEKVFGSFFQLWYREKYHRYIYQLIVNGQMICSLEDANNNVEQCNKWNQYIYYTISFEIVLLIYLIFIVSPKYKHTEMEANGNE